MCINKSVRTHVVFGVLCTHTAYFELVGKGGVFSDDPLSCHQTSCWEPRLRIYRERTPASTAISHPHPPCSRTRHHLCLAPVITSASHPYPPPSVTRIYLRLSLASTSGWHSSSPLLWWLTEPWDGVCEKSEDVGGRRRRTRVAVFWRNFCLLGEWIIVKNGTICQKGVSLWGFCVFLGLI